MSSEQNNNQPDELYTLRTQYMLGHYNAALVEAKQMSRRPMTSNALKLERDEYVYKCYIALQQYDKCIIGADGMTSTPGLQALVYKAQYEAATAAAAAMGNTEDQAQQQTIILDQMKSHASSHPNNITVQLCTAQVALQSTSETVAYAYQLVSSSTSVSHHPEVIAFKVQIYIKIDRIDLAQKELQLLQQIMGSDESVLVELCIIYIGLVTGRSIGNDLEHRITALCEQYGPSVYLLQLSCAIYMVQGNVVAAEQTIHDCFRDFENDITSLQQSELTIQLCTIYHQQPNKIPTEGKALLQELLNTTGTSTTTTTTTTKTVSSMLFQTNYERVTTAYDRESVRYMTN